MTKYQRQVSLPRVWLDEIESYYKEKAIALNKININSYTECLRVLANLGRKPLDKILEDLLTETSSVDLR